jgi:hypothetical protein
MVLFLLGHPAKECAYQPLFDECLGKSLIDSFCSNLQGNAAFQDGGHLQSGLPKEPCILQQPEKGLFAPEQNRPEEHSPTEALDR